MLWEADLEICCGVVNDSWGRSVLFTHKKWAIDWDANSCSLNAVGVSCSIPLAGSMRILFVEGR